MKEGGEEVERKPNSKCFVLRDLVHLRHDDSTFPRLLDEDLADSNSEESVVALDDRTTLDH
jgi:hypothetical protein